MANQSPLVGLSIVTRKNLFDRYVPKGQRTPTPQESANIAVPKTGRPARIRITKARKFPYVGQMFEVREVWDYGLNRWYEIDRKRRPDLDGKQDVLFPLLGDESHAEIDEHLRMSDEKDKWFKERPKVDFQKIMDKIEDQRRSHVPGRVVFGGMK